MMPSVFINVPVTDKSWPVTWSVPVPLWTRFLNAPPEAPVSSVCVPALVKVIVLLPGVKVPPVLDQLPETVKAPDGATNVPVPETLTSLLLTGPVEPLNAPLETVSTAVLTVPDEALKLPPLTVRPPEKFCVPVLAR